jgi:cold shock CspA family protein
MSGATPAFRWPAARREAVAGTVMSFDADRGVGVVADQDGRELFFHCTAITDGSRQVEAGRAVSFVVGPGHRGLLEARSVEKR